MMTIRIKTSPLHQTFVPEKLGNFIKKYVEIVEKMGWVAFWVARQGHSGFMSLEGVRHLVFRLLHQYKHHGAPVAFAGKIWTQGQQEAALTRGLHQSADENTPFLCS